MEQLKFNSAFKNYAKTSYVVLLRYKDSNGFLETRSKDGALKRCAQFKISHKAECYKINCLTGEPIKRLS